MSAHSRARHRLSNNKVKTIATPGMHHDGAGLYLLLAPSGSKSWIYRFTKDKRTREMGLGPYPTFSLDEARERANRQRQLLADGIDPLAAKRQRAEDQVIEQARRTTFQDCAEDFLITMGPTWKSEKDAKIWPQRFNTYVYSTMGPLPVAAVDTETVLSTLRPIWTSKAETAERIRSKIEAILDYATVKGLRSGDNPATKKLLGKALPAKAKKVEHHEALPYAEVPDFMAKLRRRRGRTGQSQLVALAVEWVILTAARSGEVRGATEAELDWERRLWTIPASRMKASREHIVPLPEPLRALYDNILFRAPMGSGRLFPVSDTAMRRLACQIAGKRVTLHSFRSSFRDWCSETGVRRELAEAALAHVVGNKTEAAYNRTALVEQRRPIMEAWTAFIYGRDLRAAG